MKKFAIVLFALSSIGQLKASLDAQKMLSSIAAILRGTREIHPTLAIDSSELIRAQARAYLDAYPSETTAREVENFLSVSMMAYSAANPGVSEADLIEHQAQNLVRYATPSCSPTLRYTPPMEYVE